MLKETNNSQSLGNPKKGSPVRILSSVEIFQGGREVIIQHCEKQYRLQVTKAGKLILIK